MILSLLLCTTKAGDVFVTWIDEDCLSLVDSFSGTWYPYYNPTAKSYYAYCNIPKERGKKLCPVRLHRVITGAPLGLVVDHINHDTLDNRKSNLRIITRAQNQQNRLGAQRNNKSSGIRGVYPSFGKWQAAIHIDGKKKHIGTYDDIEEAAKAAKEAREKYMPFSFT